MAKYFLGSVGKAEAFKLNSNNELELAFVSKTLTDSGLNISTTKDDIRAGEGAPVQFSFYHDSNVEITLTDVLWKPEYLEAQLGANFEAGTQDYITDVVSFANGAATYAKEIKEAPIPCADVNKYLVWGAKKGSDDWRIVGCTKSGSNYNLTLAGASGEYCIRYLGVCDNAKIAEITSTIIPQELFLVITAPIFAGDACAASRGKAAGHITFEVPRFQLNGAQEFSMNMSQNQTMSLAGIALASESAECDVNGGKLLRIIEVIDNRNWTDDIDAIMSEAESQELNNTPVIYGILRDGHLIKLELSKLQMKKGEGSYADIATGFKYTEAGTYKFRLKEKPAIETADVVVPRT